ncbi:MAG: pirin family protein [Gammaproteobacteria bacterium]|nr:pirin family protein [Gammaproteobacteria bacterium]
MSAAIETIIEPRSRDLGGFQVRRVLPAGRQRKMVGPFIFFDHMGPADLAAGQGIDVRPHPHIGLATVTYLFDGEIVHRDSLGYVQPIKPGDVNWMTAGSGIVHSERTGDEERARASRLFGIQSWVALPKRAEETEPGFYHHPKATLPMIESEGVAMRLIAGAAYGERSPVEIFSEMFYLDAGMFAGSTLKLPSEYEERAVYPVEGDVMLNGQTLSAGDMTVIVPGADAELQCRRDARVMLLGGATLEGDRHIWWNFVSSSTDRIERAKADWKQSRFPKVPGESEFIPLPPS